MGKIFVNYRRDDSAPHALSIAQYLERRFGSRNVFIDIDRMRAGQDFYDVLEQRLAVCDVMLAVIGPSWREARDSAGRHRLDDRDDWVRVEVARALARGVTVVPVLVGGAVLPKPSDLPDDLKPLVKRHAVTISTNSFRSDMAGLERDLRATLRTKQRWAAPVLIAAMVVAVFVFGYMALAWLRPTTGELSVAGRTPTLPAAAAKPDQPKPPPIAGTSNAIALDFSRAEAGGPPRYAVVADPYLRDNQIAVSVSARMPADSRIVFVNNLGLYAGRAVTPTVSQNFLTQIDTDNVPASFTLKFAKPLSSLTFMVPKVYPATESGVTFPAWRAIAFAASGAELSSASEALTRRFADVPSRTYTLTAPAFEGIASVEFQSDPNLNGRPFAGFSAILIEQITLQPK